MKDLLSLPYVPTYCSVFALNKVTFLSYICRAFRSEDPMALAN